MADSTQLFGKDIQSFDENIDSVAGGVTDLLWQRHRKLMMGSFVVALFCGFWVLAAFLLGFLKVSDPRFNFIAYGTPLAMVLAFLPAILYAQASQGIRGLFFEQLAQALGLAYAPSAPFDSAVGHLFSMGDSHSLSDVLSGSYRGFPLRLYTLTFYTGSGRSRSRHEASVCELTLASTVPGLMVIGQDVGIDTGLEDMWNPKGAKRLSLEGDFNKVFDVYAEVGKEAEALQILEPDSMQTLKEKFADYGFECCENRLNVFTDPVTLTKENYAKFLSRTDDLLDLLLPELGAVTRGGAAIPSAA